MTFPRSILHEKNLASVDDPHLAITCGDLHSSVKVNYILTPGSWVPVQIIIARCFPENYTRSRKPFRKLTIPHIFDPLNFHITEVRFTFVINVYIVDVHLDLSLRLFAARFSIE